MSDQKRPDEKLRSVLRDRQRSTVRKILFRPCPVCGGSGKAPDKKA